jgi:hypothetical protein
VGFDPKAAMGIGDKYHQLLKTMTEEYLYRSDEKNWTYATFFRFNNKIYYFFRPPSKKEKPHEFNNNRKLPDLRVYRKMTNKGWNTLLSRFTFNETQHFERGLDPKEAMSTGSYADIPAFKCRVCKKPTHNAHFKICDACYDDGWNTDMDGSLINVFETQSFKRGLDPKEAMDIGVPKCKICKKVLKYPKSGDVCRYCSDIEWEKQILLDHLKSDFRSWEEGGTIQDVDNLTQILSEKFPKIPEEWIRNVALDWIGPEDEEENDINESFYPTLFEYGYNEDDEDFEDENDYDEEDEEDTGYVPEAHKDAHHLYYDGDGTYQKEYEHYWKELVPDPGNSDTIQGELLRCIAGIVHDRYNNGFGNSRENDAKQLEKYKGKFIPYLKNPDVFDKFYRYYYDINFGYNRYVKNNWIGDGYFDPIMDAIIKYIMNSEKFDPLPEGDKYFKN